MKIGDIVTWPWYLGTDWEITQMQGLIVNSRPVNASFGETTVFDVLLTDGTMTEVPENEDGLEKVA